MAEVQDFRSLVMDAASCTATLLGGLLELLSPLERKVTESSAPSLEQSRFWVIGRGPSTGKQAVIAWSRVRMVAKAAGELASKLGVRDVVLVDCETDDEEEIRAA